ncbi:MAG: STAS domain-containing protein [Trichloromonas sp.]|jgi:hypothetical protein|nr:STAS domain-containing protein [Trichloromonas sp.]
MLECTFLPPSGQQPATLRVSGNAGIAFILQFKNALVEALQAHPHLHVDCAGVSEADFSCVQLLWSAHQSFPEMRVTPASRGALGPVILAAGLDRVQGCCLAEDSADCLWVCPDSPESLA